MPKTPLTDQQKAKLKKGKCGTYGCRGPAQHGYYCNRCRCKRRNPIKVSYENIKGRAKRDNIFFALTYQYFENWAKENRYIELKGKQAGSASVDRIKPELGYIDGNIQLLKLAENSRKRWVDYWAKQGEVPDDYVPPKVERIRPNQDIQEEELPF